MSKVTLHIGGRDYTLACADGEEDRIVALATMVEDKLDQLGENVAAAPAQNMLFAALLLADELHDCEGKAAAAGSDSAKALDDLQREFDAIRSERDEALLKLADSQQQASQLDGKLIARLGRLAEQMENRAEMLEAKVAAS